MHLRYVRTTHLFVDLYSCLDMVTTYFTVTMVLAFTIIMQHHNKNFGYSRYNACVHH